ncbi:hypothetical protein HY490_04090 [Candidatus Woesearchaeota archaeon]|nr:hypothetical protein [Candidatus Woesearchaeota archaeon]
MKLITLWSSGAFVVVLLAALATIFIATGQPFVDIHQPCGTPFSKDLYEPCTCANECKIALVCTRVNDTNQCMNIMSDYARDWETEKTILKESR